MPHSEKQTIERRYFKAEDLRFEQRAGQSDTELTLTGHCLKFNVLSQNLGGFREKIAPSFVDDMITEEQLMGDDDCKALFNHNPDLVLARTNNETNRLKKDKVGLYCEIDCIDTSAGRDTILNVKSGRISQMSFAFAYAEDHWEVKDGENIRTLLKGRKLYDDSPVTYPAYLDTDIGARALLDRPELDYARLLNAKVRAERGLPCTKDDVSILREAEQVLIKLQEAIRKAEAPPVTPPQGRALLDLELQIRLLNH